MDLAEYPAQVVAEFPIWIMALEFANVADPPDVIADPVLSFVLPAQSVSGDFLAEIDRF